MALLLVSAIRPAALGGPRSRRPPRSRVKRHVEVVTKIHASEAAERLAPRCGPAPRRSWRSTPDAYARRTAQIRNPAHHGVGPGRPGAPRRPTAGQRAVPDSIARRRGHDHGSVRRRGCGDPTTRHQTGPQLRCGSWPRRTGSTASGQWDGTHIGRDLTGRNGYRSLVHTAGVSCTACALCTTTRWCAPPPAPCAQLFFTRHARSNGSRQAFGAISWWIALGPQLPGG